MRLFFTCINYSAASRWKEDNRYSVSVTASLICVRTPYNGLKLSETLVYNCFALGTNIVAHFVTLLYLLFLNSLQEPV